ncbi:MAG: hypothetical protein HRF43_11865 [Phycisphaerae bacterium]
MIPKESAWGSRSHCSWRGGKDNILSGLHGKPQQGRGYRCPDPLGELAAAERSGIELLLVGGGVMVSVFGTRPATRDLDVVVLPPSDPGRVRALAAVVAEERGWEEDWLNDAAKGFVVGLSSGPVIFSAPGIVVRRPAIEQLAAMKLCAWRDDVDVADAKRLLQELDTDYNETWRRIEPFLQPGRELKAKYAFDDLWENLHGQP